MEYETNDKTDRMYAIRQNYKATNAYRNNQYSDFVRQFNIVAYQTDVKKEYKNEDGLQALLDY